MTEEAAQNPGLKLLIPEDIRYNCQGCGRCCSGWSVGLTEEDYSRVKNTDWQSLHPELKDKEVFFHREKEFLEGTAAYPHYTKPRDDGSCPFLIDNLCFIHSHLGEYEKPITCRVFPYSFVETPSGVYTGVVYNSMASVRNIGAPPDRAERKTGGVFQSFYPAQKCLDASGRAGEPTQGQSGRDDGGTGQPLQ